MVVNINGAQTMNLDPYDMLWAACKAAPSYPTNLLRTRTFPHTLESYRTLLDEEESRLFTSTPTDHMIVLSEAFDGTDSWFHFTTSINPF
jgi:hypothetical protein